VSFAFSLHKGKQRIVWPQSHSLWRGIPSKDHGSLPWKPLLKLLVGGLDQRVWFFFFFFQFPSFVFFGIFFADIMSRLLATCAPVKFIIIVV
jgi:hypothetical protein